MSTVTWIRQHPVDDEDMDTVRKTIEQIMPVPSSPIQSEDEEDGVEVIKNTISRRQANECINTLRDFFQSKAYDTIPELQTLMDLESKINTTQVTKQSTISSFFLSK